MDDARPDPPDLADVNMDMEREVLALLEEALNEPAESRRAWLERRLRQNLEIGSRVEDLLAVADRYGF